MLLLGTMLLTATALSQKPIDTSFVFTIGGIQQYVHAKGKDDSKPLMLILHGGPGSSLMQKMDQLTGHLQQQLVIVQWDQRQTGETLKRNPSKQPLTLELFYNDTHELIDSLLLRFQRSKLYLVQKINGASAEEVNLLYLDEGGIKGHQLLQSTMNDVRSTATDANLKALATATLPVIQTHLQVSQDVRTAMDKGKGSKTRN